MYTIAIYEALGVKYDVLFLHGKRTAIKKIKAIIDTAHIHYIEEVPKTDYFKQQPRLIIR